MDVLAGLSVGAISLALIGLMVVDGLVLVGVLVPGDLVVVTASSTLGVPAILGVGLLGVAALVGGHVASFFVGRRYGPHLWTSRLGRKVGFERWCRAEQTFREGGDRTVLLTPFLPVVNTVLPALAGALGVPPRRYLVLIVLADLAWVGVWTLTGIASGLLASALGAADLALLVSGAVAATALIVTALVLRHSHRRAAPLRCSLPGHPLPGEGVGAPVTATDGEEAHPVPEDTRSAGRRVTLQHHVATTAPDGDTGSAERRRARERELRVVIHHPLTGVSVVELDGDLTIDTSPRFDRVLAEELAAGPRHLVVDLGRVRFVNYHGLVTLVAARHHAHQDGVAFHLTGAGRGVIARTLRATRTHDHFRHHRSLSGLLDQLQAENSETAVDEHRQTEGRP